MDKVHHIAGVVLAGGRSSRMGRNKALLEYDGRPLLEHMLEILKQSGCDTVMISGNVEGYECIKDDAPFSGPATAINSVISKFPEYDGFLFVPVDMPLLESEVLRFLMQQEGGGYFTGAPLPAFIKSPYLNSRASSVQALLDDFAIRSVELPERFLPFMKNANTPQQWREVAGL